MVSPSVDEMEAMELATWQRDEPDPDENCIVDRSWLRLIEVVAPTINPETAEVTWGRAPPDDPYDFLDLHGGSEKDDEYLYYARVPESERKPLSHFMAYAAGCSVDAWPWVWFGDLPEAVRDALWAKHGERLLKEVKEDDEKRARRRAELLASLREQAEAGDPDARVLLEPIDARNQNR